MNFFLQIFKLLLFSIIQRVIFRKNVIIIGSGPSGIAAATRLLEANVTDILVLEAENRIGGRVYTKPFGEHVIEMGAEWCHGGKDNVVYEMAHPLGYLEESYVWNETNFTKYSKMSIFGKILNKETAHNLASFFFETADDDDYVTDPKESVGDFLARFILAQLKTHKKLKNLSKEVQENLVNWYSQLVLSREASESLYNISLEGNSQYHPTEGHQNFEWKKGGYKTILEILMKKIPDRSKQSNIEDKILLNKEVTNIKWDNLNNGVTIQCKDGSMYTSDSVILTMSVGVLKHDLHTLFTPELPVIKQNAIRGISLGAVAKVFLEFDEPWWSDALFLHFFWTNETKQEFKKVFNESDDWLLNIPFVQSVAYQPKLLLGWVIGKSVAKMELLDETYVKTQVMKLIRQFYAPIYTIPEPKTFMRTTWRTNPHFRGTWSHHGYDMYKYNTSSFDLAAPVLNSNQKQVLHFAGEATSDHHFGTVHGAIETRWREADRILKNRFKNE